MSKDRQAAREAKLLIAMINNEGSNKKDTEKVKQYILEPKNISLCSETQNGQLHVWDHQQILPEIGSPEWQLLTLCAIAYKN